MKKGKLGFSRFYKVNLRLKAVGIWIALAPFIGNQRILTNARGNVWKQFTAKLLVIWPQQHSSGRILTLTYFSGPGLLTRRNYLRA